MPWLPKKLKAHLDARAAEIEKRIEAPIADEAKIDAAIAEMVSKRQSRAEPAPAAPRSTPDAAPPPRGFGRRGL